MSKDISKGFVIDSSAIIAFIKKNPGHTISENYIKGDAIFTSSVNFSETLFAIKRMGVDKYSSEEHFFKLIPNIIFWLRRKRRSVSNRKDS